MAGLSIDYSKTNVQVQGVDEADIVKTDGEYIYTLQGSSLLILRAYPSENAELVKNMTFTEMYPTAIYVNGDRLIVLGGKYTVPQTMPYYFQSYFIDVKTSIHVYDIQNRTSPTLLRELTLTGSYFNSRMMQDYVYFVVSQPAYVIYDTVILPKIYEGDQPVKEISPSEIRYYNGTDNYYQYTTFIAVNVENPDEAPVYLTMMLGGTSTMYVSLQNIYVTFPQSSWTNWGNTTVYRIRYQGNNMTAEAKGTVLGRELNQFSMDEYNDHLRIATSDQTQWPPPTNLYVLDMNLTVVGNILNIEPGETMDSTRFIENRCYLSTSVVRRDPFFVIDLQNVTDPKILGYLKIPGFTRYLHPYDDNHVIGVGRDEQNKVRVMLFEVTNVTAPIVISEYTVEGTWSDSQALTDHKAFLFSKDKDLLAIPISYQDYTATYQNWQGLFVFNITLDSGTALRGKITHQEFATSSWDTAYQVQRALYIENVLYTVSPKLVKLNNLQTLDFIKSIPIS
jgi:uncharacterized secreted protein with C-terminal beta-propeller domain